MKKSLLLCLTSALLFTASAPSIASMFHANRDTSTTPFIGSYHCKGTDPLYGGEYKSVLHVAAVSGQSSKLRLLWQYPHNGGSGRGTGFVSNGLLVLVFEGIASSSPGVASYALADGGQVLAGKFTYLFHRDSDIGSETCQRDREKAN